MVWRQDVMLGGPGDGPIRQAGEPAANGRSRRRARCSAKEVLLDHIRHE